MLITQEQIEEAFYTKGISPWQYLLEEAKKPKEVNSDDDPPADQMETGNPHDGKGLSDEEIMQIVQALQQGQIQEDQIQKMMEDGQLSEDDMQRIQQAMQQADGGSPQEPSPEEQQTMQINQLQDTVVRFSIYDKLGNLQNKLEQFLDHFNDVTSDLYKQTEEIYDYIKILNSLIFNLEINLVYQLYSQLEMKLIDIFEEYIAENNIQKNENNTQENKGF